MELSKKLHLYAKIRTKTQHGTISHQGPTELTITYKILLTSCYRSSLRVRNVIEKPHACQYQSKNKIIYIDPTQSV
jgi:hypothetical protein